MADALCFNDLNHRYNSSAEILDAEMKTSTINRVIAIPVTDRIDASQDNAKELTGEPVTADFDISLYETNQHVVQSDYIAGYEELWLINIFGDLEYNKRLIHKNNYIITNELIEKIISDSKVVFYLDEREKHLFFYDGPMWQKNFGELKSIPGIESLKRFGLHKMEEASEHGLANIP